MAARESAATVRALRLVEHGWTAYRAAKHVGIALSTIYRAVARQRATGADMKTVTNPFRDKTMRREFDAAVYAYETRHRNLFNPQTGEPAAGNAFAHFFWTGFNGKTIGAGFDAESKKMIGYAYFRAGELLAVARQRASKASTEQR